MPGTINKSNTSGASFRWFSRSSSFALLRFLPEDMLRSAGQPCVTADGSKISFPLVLVTCDYSPEVQPFPVARDPILHLHCGHLQHQLIRVLRIWLFTSAKLFHVYLFPQSTASMVSADIEK